MASINHPSSFRDPAGFIFIKDDKVYRQINQTGLDDYEMMMGGGLYDTLVNQGLMVSHQESDEFKTKTHKIIEPERIPFISYPYEWTFAQLKDAALLTLKIQRLAMNHGMILKDASAYNIQFVGRRPKLIDSLSFKKYTAGEPWEGYKQFCEHFMAPLALAAYSGQEILRSQKAYINGWPLSLAAALLPRRARLRMGLLTHIFLHAASQRRYDSAGHKAKTKVRRVSPNALAGLLLNLEKTIKKLNHPSERTEWGEYYQDTNYSDKAFSSKKKLVSEMLADISGSLELVWDLGANDGTFSKLASNAGAYTVAFDIDMSAVEKNYKAGTEDAVMPLVMDFSNPSPDLGWAHTERQSLANRGPADAALALALIHHMAIGNNLPFEAVASYFARITRHLIIEFVPKDDSKVQLLLASRRDIFDDYDQDNFESTFNLHFTQLDKKAVAGSKRVIYLYKSKTK